MSHILTYNNVVQDYAYKLMAIFIAKNPAELRESFHELYAFKNIVEEAHAMSKIKELAERMEPKVIKSEVLAKIEKSINSTFDMHYQEMPFHQVLGKMHADLDEYKKLLTENL